MLRALAVFLAVALLSPAFASPGVPAARSYPNGDQAVHIDRAPGWLLLEGHVPAAAIEAVLIKQPGAVLVRYESLVRRRTAVLIGGVPDVDLFADALVTAGVTAQTWPAWGRESGVGFFDDHLVVAFEGAPSPEVVDAAGGKLLRATGLPGVWTAQAYGGDAIDVAWRLNDQPGVRWAEPDLIRHVETYDIPNDPNLGEQWHLVGDAPGGIDAAGAWATTTGDPQVVMGIFDTGYDLDHPDLVGNIVGGFDAVSRDDTAEAECWASPDGAGPAQGCPNNAPYRESHGTAVAGVVAAQGANDLLGTGVCPDCTLFTVRLLGGASLASISNAEAFQRAADEGVWAINNSWGPSLTRFFPLSVSERETFDRITTQGRDGKGVVLVFAAGNDFFTPATANPYAAHPGVLTISASTRTDDFACYSNYGSVIAVSGPSRGCFGGESGIATTDYAGPNGYGPGDWTNSFGGTSAASPVVAGVVGLVLSANPALTAQQVRLVLQESAEKIVADKNPWEAQYGIDLAAEFAYDDNGFSQGFGYGRVNAARAVALALNPPLTGATCDEACPTCVAGRCAPACETDLDCPGASRCVSPEPDAPTVCVIPQPQVGDIGQPCGAGCEACVDTINSEQRLDRICTAQCEADPDCPFGFDCRQLYAGDPWICVPGNAECGTVWGDTRCQSDTRVVGGAVEYCSCDCIPDTPGACPEGFLCSAVDCEQVRGGVSCTATEGRGNYRPSCVPDPDFRQPCQLHTECPGGTFCISRVCQADTAEAGCDACAPCEVDADCNENSACIDFTRGKRCAPHCEGNGAECPGDADCVEIPGPAGFHCVNPDWRRKGFCPRAYRCQVDGRCWTNADCENGGCAENLCPGAEPDAAVVDAMVEDAGVVDAAPIDDAATPDAGGAERATQDDGCRSTDAPAPLWAAGLLALVMIRRRRR